jgi:hypothetical protein
VSEQDLVNAILDYLHLNGAWAERINSGTQVIEAANGKRRVFRGAKKGTADILACWPGGLFMAVEAKLIGNTTTPDQDLFLETIRDAGGLAIVAYSVDDVEAAIRKRIQEVA